MTHRNIEITPVRYYCGSPCAAPWIASWEAGNLSGYTTGETEQAAVESAKRVLDCLLG